jgi:ABC-2 type transport system permease protein
MSMIKIISTATRVMTQLKNDPRTLALLFIVPSLLLIILKYVFDNQTKSFNSIAPMLLGIFPLVLMFLITSIATLRERRTGTLARLMTMPISKLDIILGYALAFFMAAVVQAVITSFVMLSLLNVSVRGGIVATIIGAISAAVLGTALGLLSSAFAATEFQAVQFMPALIFPQLLVCGLFAARSEMAKPLQLFSDVMPLTYSVDLMKQITQTSTWTTTDSKDLAIILGVTVLALILGSISIKRRVKAH